MKEEYLKRLLFFFITILVWTLFWIWASKFITE